MTAEDPERGFESFLRLPLRIVPLDLLIPRLSGTDMIRE
jgi:hypothetical protein